MITLVAVLIPESAITILLLVYPSPGLIILIEVRNFFFVTDVISCTPVPYDVKSILFVPETASENVLCNVIVFDPVTLTKYSDKLTRPPITVSVWLSYTILSPVLNL